MCVFITSYGVIYFAINEIKINILQTRGTARLSPGDYVLPVNNFLFKIYLFLTETFLGTYTDNLKFKVSPAPRAAKRPITL